MNTPLVVTGTIDGVNATFTVSPTPTYLLFYRNNIFQDPGQTYTLAGATVTFQPGFIPIPGDLLTASDYVGVTVQEVYNAVTAVLQEDGGFVSGVYTQAQFLNALAVVLLDFSQRAALYKTVFTEMINAGESLYIVPENLMRPELCFVGGKLIEKTTEADLTQGHFEWKMKNGMPRQWHEDNLPPKRVQVFPTPDFNGANIPGPGPIIGTYEGFQPSQNNLTIVGPSAPAQISWAIADTLSGISASFAHYLVYGVLEQIFSAEGETRDISRANYARARYAECFAIADAIAREELMEEADD